MYRFKNITLEMSLKPFKSLEQGEVEAVCEELFSQWQALLAHTGQVSVMLWTSDGSELLDYNGKYGDTFEWACWIGGANVRTDWNKKADPKGLGLHTICYPYMENPPVYTYGDLKRVVETLRRVGQRVTGKPVRVGTTFDPGPEFAVSTFKYERHPEILMGDTMGKASFVCCYGVLHGDDRPYAGFPEGIPEGTPFGTFLGRQSRHFLTDMGLDYIWLSNGLGFGSETWGATGAIFDGKAFYPEKIENTKGRILDFWKLFRQECDFPVETRGTNLTFGIDFASDAVDLMGIYRGGFDILPPPNSPWAALDGDFGLELAGYMSRIAELPATDYLFRFYIHDPWWMNSPWLDRYEGQPHDIYLPLAVTRLDGEGRVHMPNHLNLLTVDNSLGELPRQVPNEVTPHLIKAVTEGPDAPSPFVWVYPFGEYARQASGRVGKSFYEDWFVRGAINHGLPLSTVISTDNFLEVTAKKPGFFAGSVLVFSVPEAGSPMNSTILDFAASGGKVFLYGSVEGADLRLLNALNLDYAPALEGELALHMKDELAQSGDFIRTGRYGDKINHVSLMSDGGVNTILRKEAQEGVKVLATVSRDGQERVEALYRTHPKWQGGGIVWIRGVNGGALKGGHILTPFPAESHYPVESFMRLSAGLFGYEINFAKETPQARNPIIMLHRHENAFRFSFYSPDTTSQTSLKLPLGAPLLTGVETRLNNGTAHYTLPRAYEAECRVFVEQEDGVVGVKEIAPVSFQMRRRLNISGLKNAVVRVLPKTGFETRTELLYNSSYPFMAGEAIQYTLVDTPYGAVLEARGVTGTLTVSDRYAEDIKP